ncbi:DUF3006 domain-containing protein [Bacillus sp. FJAT-27445]|uniref:DUF3006 domain-containing protein n=1 Tax=Bacillus sp. FJAT-27445 TaxID=1679166 RepID=UPI0007441FC6|nr:DUF3006 domain-containing protein [Bacillus sp. FJAT-27445]
MKSNKFTVDRFEGDKIVLLKRDDEKIEMVLSKSKLPGSVVEGDILLITFKEDGTVSNVEHLKDETEKARNRAIELLNKLKNK